MRSSTLGLKVGLLALVVVSCTGDDGDGGSGGTSTFDPGTYGGPDPSTDCPGKLEPVEHAGEVAIVGDGTAASCTEQALHDAVAGLNVVEGGGTVVPAPTRWMAARRRGGDPVARMAVAATAPHPGLRVIDALRMRTGGRDSVGLSGADRLRNVTGRVKVRRSVDGAVVLVDDIVTTGATAAESVRILHGHGAHVLAVLAVVNA